MASGLLFIFWLILVVFAIPQFRSEIQRYDSEKLNSWTEYQFTSYIIYFILICVMFLLNCFADKFPENSTFATTANLSPEVTSSYLRQILYQWFDHTIYNGWKRPLTESDIYDINPENSSKEVVPAFDKYFNESILKNRK